MDTIDILSTNVGDINIEGDWEAKDALSKMVRGYRCFMPKHGITEVSPSNELIETLNKLADILYTKHIVIDTLKIIKSKEICKECGKLK